MTNFGIAPFIFNIMQHTAGPPNVHQCFERKKYTFKLGMLHVFKIKVSYDGLSWVSNHNFASVMTQNLDAL